MSEANGPYTVGTFAGNFVHVIRDGASVGPVFHSSSTVEKAAVIANLAHHHALAAQAERVAGLEAALKVAREFIDEASCLNDDDVAGFVDDGYFAVLRKIDALTPPAKENT